MKPETPLDAIRAAGEAALALPPAEVPAVLGELERLKGLLWVRLSAPVPMPPGPSEGDRLLDVKEAAQKLGISPSTLYKKADEYPFTIRQLASRVQFSSRGIDDFIQRSAMQIPRAWTAPK